MSLGYSGIHYLLFGLYPYLALAICLFGSWARYDLAQYTWRAQSSQFLDKTSMRWMSNAFHIGILFILMGHFVGLLTPHRLYASLISAHDKQLLAMVSGGSFGLLCLLGLLGLLHRRLSNQRIRRTSHPTDLWILWVLLAQLLLGLGTIVQSTQHLDGSVMLSLAEWAQDEVCLHPVAAVQAITPVPLIYKLHISLGLTLFVLFPFTRLVHIISVPIWYLGRRYQIVRQRS